MKCFVAGIERDERDLFLKYIYINTRGNLRNCVEPGLFTGIGKMKDFQAQLHIDVSVSPPTQPHRGISVSFAKKLDAELHKLQREGSIEPAKRRGFPLSSDHQTQTAFAAIVFQDVIRQYKRFKNICTKLTAITLTAHATLVMTSFLDAINKPTSAIFSLSSHGYAS